VGGVLGTVIGLMYYTRMQNYPIVIAAIILVALVDYSRYKLKAHNAFDLYIGNIIGIACQALVFIIMGK
jgi:membrane-associated phospholipid phosphatase